jgi:PAS domain S-box-containing protein
MDNEKSNDDHYLVDKLSDKHGQDNLPINPSLLLKALLENSKMAAIFIMDEKGTILRANPGAFKRFGYTEEDIVGKNFSLLFTKEDRSASNPERELKTALETGSGIDNNYIVHKNKRHLWCHGESIRARNEQGKIFFVKIIFDIDEQKRLENTLSRRNKDLSNFVYTTSHDLKSPINNIEGLINTFNSHPEILKKYEKEITMMKESIIKFKNMLNDLAEIGKSQEDKITEVIFKEILEETKFNLRTEIKKSNTIIFDDFSQAPLIKFSKTNLRSIFHNMLSNSIKFRSPDRRPEIIISTEKIDSEFLLKFRDNGIGIKEDDKNKIFSIYSRINKDVEGTGVGMAIISRIVENNGGKIDIESQEGKGTTFLIYLKEGSLIE